MDIILYEYGGEPNRLNKNLSDGTTLTGALRQSSSVTNPIITINMIDDLIANNYAYIPAFGRYYFINDIVIERTDIAVLYLKCDVLMSFKDEINHSSVIIDRSSIIPDVGSPYLQTENDVVLAKRKTDIINFESGFNEDGEFILITAGGFAT